MSQIQMPLPLEKSEECRAVKQSRWQRASTEAKEAARKRSSEWRLKNIDRIKEKDRMKYARNREKIKSRSKARYEAHKCAIIAQQTAARKARAAALRAERENSGELELIRARRAERFKQKRRIYHRDYERRRMACDPAYRARKTLSVRLRNALRKVGVRKTISTMDLLGCEIEFFESYISKQFTAGMSWDNHGEWHIDHARPCASFDLSDPVQQRKCFHFTNLQPLWAVENIRKSDTVAA